ncbi:hypothetical protein CH341_22570 [Rhodoplanes roseus]|uniref:Uncharacterized protein n=1 Tax=Rhodoplanes roseus TaxID=29409 RepID=A0A327KSU6_9BRAD|nr:hypothetical protein CH341_22570 [Rhodoplanes roseus]
MRREEGVARLVQIESHGPAKRLRHPGIAGWPKNAAPASDGIVASISKLLTTLDQAISDIDAKQGDHTACGWAAAA